MASAPASRGDAVSVDPADLAVRIKEVFNRFDKDGGGSLDRHELQMVFRTLCPSFTAQYITFCVKQLDRGGDGQVSAEEFVDWIKKGSEEALEVFAIILKATGDEMSNRVREVFQRFDSDGGGFLDRDELSRVFRTLNSNFTLKDIDALVKDLDRGGDGKVSHREFMAWLKRGSDGAKAVTKAITRETGNAREERIQKAFRKYDATGDGSLDIEELRQTLKVLGSFSEHEVRIVCEDLDKSKDGEVSLEEFSAWIKAGTGGKECQKAKAILAPSDSDGLEAVFYNFCGAGHADMDGKSFKKLCVDCDLTDKSFKAAEADLVFSDIRVKGKGQKVIDFYQFEVALELVADKKGVSKADVRTPVLLQGSPKIVGTKATAAPNFTVPGEGAARGKKPKRSASERRVAAILRAPLNETVGEETWRKDVDNSQLWKIFGLESKAGLALKRIYSPPQQVVAAPPVQSRSLRPLSALSTHSAASSEGNKLLAKSMSLPWIAKTQGSMRPASGRLKRPVSSAVIRPGSTGVRPLSGASPVSKGPQLLLSADACYP
eukprot:TRINITY_DN23123_c0_g1_i1.p1 TRINITY_DN23123_c0_g1~~TRINITY_DN23123_c0_g1_i1.p1  ORF type:complete len:547 (-),score=148.09 TRINITY_DN23123_c0_g1_i1:113-1753(-)